MSGNHQPAKPIQKALEGNEPDLGQLIRLDREPDKVYVTFFDAADLSTVARSRIEVR